MLSNYTGMQDKYCGQCCNIHPIHSQYNGNHKRGGLRPRPFVCDGGQRPPPLSIGFEQGEYRTSHHNNCLTCWCDRISCSSPAVLHVPSPFVPCALACEGCLAGPCSPGGIWGGLRPISNPKFIFCSVWKGCHI